MPQIAYGFMDLADHFSTLVTQMDTEIIDTAVRESAEVHDRDMRTLLANLVEPTTRWQERYELPTGGEMQPLSENGTPLPRKGFVKYSVGYPMGRAGDSFGANRETWAKMTVGEMNRRMLNVQTADAKWITRRILAAILTNQNYTYNDDNDDIGALNVVALANQDGQQYMTLAGGLAQRNHFHAQAADISNGANPYAALYNRLNAHPGNTGQFVTYIAENLRDDTENLIGFREYEAANPLVRVSADETVLRAEAERYLGFGNEVIGYINKQVIVTSRLLPDGYIIAQATGVGAPLVMREEPEESLRGLKMVTHQVDSNFRKIDFYRKAGFAVRNRVALAVAQVGAAVDGTYQIPTGFDIRYLWQ